MKYALAAVAVALLCGCEESPYAMHQREVQATPIYLVGEQVSNAGDAAEMRAWTFRDGTSWMIIGRYGSFVVFEKSTGDWRPVAISVGTQLPEPIQRAITPRAVER